MVLREKQVASSIFTIAQYFKADDSIPETDKLHNWSETTYDGQPGSFCPNIPNHWHKYHDEYMEVLEGTVTFTIDGKKTTVHAGSGEVLFVPRMAVHGFTFVKGVKTVLKEYTNPVGDFKEAYVYGSLPQEVRAAKSPLTCRERFFRDVMQTATDHGPKILMAIRAFREGDTYVALPGGFKAVDQAVSAAQSLGGSARGNAFVKCLTC